LIAAVGANSDVLYMGKSAEIANLNAPIAYLRRRQPRPLTKAGESAIELELYDFVADRV